MSNLTIVTVSEVIDVISKQPKWLRVEPAKKSANTKSSGVQYFNIQIFKDSRWQPFLLTLIGFRPRMKVIHDKNNSDNVTELQVKVDQKTKLYMRDPNGTYSEGSGSKFEAGEALFRIMSEIDKQLKEYQSSNSIYAKKPFYESVKTETTYEENGQTKQYIYEVPTMKLKFQTTKEKILTSNFQFSTVNVATGKEEKKTLSTLRDIIREIPDYTSLCNCRISFSASLSTVGFASKASFYNITVNPQAFKRNTNEFTDEENSNLFGGISLATEAKSTTHQSAASSDSAGASSSTPVKAREISPDGDDVEEDADEEEDDTPELD